MTGSLALPVAITLAMLAGAGWGSALTFARLRPERLARAQHADQQRIMREIQAVHDAAVQKVINLPGRWVMTVSQPVVSGRHRARNSAIQLGHLRLRRPA